MTISANKGEHSEVFALLRILHAGRVQVADKDGNPKKAWLKVVSLRRPGNLGLVYRVTDDATVQIDSEGRKLANVERAILGEVADNLLSEIQAGSGASFVCPSTDRAADLLHFSSSKAASTAKADLFLEVASPVFEGETSNLGFSVKSELGGAPYTFERWRY